MQARAFRADSAQACGQGWFPEMGETDFARARGEGEVSIITRMEKSITSPGTSEGNRLLIVDGHCYAYRSFFAIRSLVSPQGRATNAIYGFIRTLGKIQASVRPTHVVVVWDGGLAEERMVLLPQYKAQRAEMPADLESQLDEIVHYLNAANVSSVMKPGCEADDLIACLAGRSIEKGWEVVIASSDKDFMQLAGPRVRLLNPGDKSETLWDSQQVKTKTGVEPGQVVDWLSLIGDSVDNIPGVPGVGPKTAAELLNRFGSLDEIYRRLPEVGSERLRNALDGARELARRNQQMVRLKADIGCEEQIEAMTVKGGDKERLRHLYAGWGFKKLMAELDQAQLESGALLDANR